jgi:hypothetical protein
MTLYLITLYLGTNVLFNKKKNTDRKTIEKKMKTNRSKKMSPNIKKNDKIFTIK